MTLPDRQYFHLLGVLRRGDRAEMLDVCSRILPYREWEGGPEHPPATDEELIRVINRKLGR